MISNSRDSYNLKKITKFNNIDQKYNSNDIKNSIIKPVKLEKPNINIEQIINDKIISSKKELEEAYTKRTNIPYKGIIKNFDFNKKINNETDLIVHKVTLEDKKLFNDDMSKYKKEIDTQNNELNDIYSSNKKTQHKKNFEYQHKYKYRTKLETSDNSNLRVDRIDFYKKEQSKLEDKKKKIDDILLNLIDSGILSEDCESINYNKIDTVELETRLKKEFGDAEFETLMKELSQN